MGPGEEWSWLEAYGLLEADPENVHGPDWMKAKRAVEDELDNLISYPDLLTEFEAGQEFSEAPLVEVLHHGSGWGALELRRRERFGITPFCDDSLIFSDESLSQEQFPWINLLEKGSFPASDPGKPSLGFMVSIVWQDLLERAVETDSRGNWLAWFHLGLMRYHAGDVRRARCAWEQSQKLEWTPWSARNLAVLDWREGRQDEAADLLIRACEEVPSLLPLAVECGRCLIEAGRAEQWLNLLPIFPGLIRSAGRMRLLEAQAALSQGDLETVQRFFADQVTVPDLREGEVSLSDLWFAYHQQRIGIEVNMPVDDSIRAQIESKNPVPEQLDFRMNISGDEMVR
jgi:hypothetical protein